MKPLLSVEYLTLFLIKKLALDPEEFKIVFETVDEFVIL